MRDSLENILDPTHRSLHHGDTSKEVMNTSTYLYFANESSITQNLQQKHVDDIVFAGLRRFRNQMFGESCSSIPATPQSYEPIQVIKSHSDEVCTSMKLLQPDIPGKQ